eukprot:Filipodium_phascolosomae@DN4690_c0_g1_i1.p1
MNSDQPNEWQYDQTAPNQMGMPMMPGMMMGMMPQDGYSLLQNQQKVLIKERVKVLEVMFDVEMNNAYSICTTEGGELFAAKEDSNICERNCCFKDCGPFRFDISMVPGPGMPRRNLWHAERPCTCTCLCFNRPRLRITDCINGKDLATCVDPFACCNLTFTISDMNNETIMRANGGCCQMGLWCPLPCGPCARVEFKIEDAKSGNVIGSIQKQVPGCCKFMISDADNYEVEFGAVTNPEWKAIVCCLAIFMDFRYFDDRNETQNNNETVTINL